MVRNQWGRLSTPYAWIGGGCMLAAAIAVAIRVGSPIPVWHRLDAGDILPPLWLMGTLWLAGMFAVGWVFGCLLGMRESGPARDAMKYRGLCCMALAAAFSLLWYELLFCSLSLVLSWFCLAAALLTAAQAALSWWRLCRPIACVTAGYCVWLAWLFLLQLGILFHM